MTIPLDALIGGGAVARGGSIRAAFVPPPNPEKQASFLRLAASVFCAAFDAFSFFFFFACFPVCGGAAAASTAAGRNAAAPTFVPPAASSFLSSLCAGSLAAARFCDQTFTNPASGGGAFHRHPSTPYVSRLHMPRMACQSVPGRRAMVFSSPKMTHCRLARLTATLILRPSATNPMARRGFARTGDTSTWSNSDPWHASTVRHSTLSDAGIASRSATYCPL